MTSSCLNSQESPQYLGKDSHLIWKHFITESPSKKKRGGAGIPEAELRQPSSLSLEENSGFFPSLLSFAGSRNFTELLPSLAICGSPRRAVTSMGQFPFHLQSCFFPWWGRGFLGRGEGGVVSSETIALLPFYCFFFNF